MRGIIPRAIEQIGQYKDKMKDKGWHYEMQVTFIEIYKEEVHDLLAWNASGGADHGGEAKFLSIPRGFDAQSMRRWPAAQRPAKPPETRARAAQAA